MDAYKTGDKMAFAAALEASVFRFLLPPVAALAAKMAAEARAGQDGPGVCTPQDGVVGIPGEAIDALLKSYESNSGVATPQHMAQTSGLMHGQTQNKLSF